VTTQRGASFDKRDLDKNGKLTKEEFMQKQKDPEHAAQNFLKFDKDKSGDLSREEYIRMGK
jgi:Ca2+-binding EF-hand superfamily protein